MTNQADCAVLSHLIVPFTFGSVINIDLLSSLRKLPWLCIMFDSSLSCNIPTSPAATSISVVIPSGPGHFFYGMLHNTCSTSLRVIGDSSRSLVVRINTSNKCDCKQGCNDEFGTH